MSGSHTIYSIASSLIQHNFSFGKLYKYSVINYPALFLINIQSSRKAAIHTAVQLYIQQQGRKGMRQFIKTYEK